MLLLGIETSCDETAAAVLNLSGLGNRMRPKILSDLVASQEEIHLPYGGIVPELASRRHIEILQPLVEQALSKAKVGLTDLNGIAVTHAPGLVGSLLVGLSFAKSLALGLNIPFVGVSHLEGHLNAPFLENPGIPYPQIGLIVSGGHTALYFIKGFGDYRFLGGTRDDAAGEAFDKVAKLLGLGYPGGPVIDKIAREGDPTAIKLPRPKMPKYDFSFSGLKTAVKNLSHDAQRMTHDVCASFQETVADHLIEKTMLAAKNYRCRVVVITGGVACNSRLKAKLGEICRQTGRRLFVPSPRYCTDNAAMIAYTGGRYLLKGQSSPWSLNALANLDLNQVGGVV